MIRIVLFGLAYVHTFPARRHLGLFFTRPSMDEAWKGFGALLAIALYLLPVRVYVRALGRLWRERRLLLHLAGWVLAIVHFVPALDHLPRFLEARAFADGWRGIGSALACAWFVLPLHAQAAVVAKIPRALDATRHPGRAHIPGSTVMP